MTYDGLKHATCSNPPRQDLVDSEDSILFQLAHDAQLSLLRYYEGGIFQEHQKSPL